MAPATKRRVSCWRDTVVTSCVAAALHKAHVETADKTDPNFTLGIDCTSIDCNATVKRAQAGRRDESMLLGASILRPCGRRLGPNGSHQFYAPNRASQEGYAFRFDEGRGLPTFNPNVSVRWLPPQQRRH